MRRKSSVDANASKGRRRTRRPRRVRRSPGTSRAAGDGHAPVERRSPGTGAARDCGRPRRRRDGRPRTRRVLGRHRGRERCGVQGGRFVDIHRWPAGGRTPSGAEPVGSSAELVPALEPARLDDAAAGTVGHPLPEPVLLRSTAVVGLERAFHDGSPAEGRVVLVSASPGGGAEWARQLHTAARSRRIAPTWATE